MDAIAITPTSPNVKTALDKAVAAGIKVVLVDNDIPGWSGKSSLVATDNLAGGKLAGGWLAENIPAGSKVAVLQGRLGNPSLDDRVKGFKETLDRSHSRCRAGHRLRPAQGIHAAQDVLTTTRRDGGLRRLRPPIIGALEAISSR